MPDRHSAGVLQVEPFSFLLEQTPPAQYSSWLQPASDVHEFAVPPHSVPLMHVEPGGHAFSVFAGQLPAPSQKAARIALPLTHWASRQETPGPGYTQERVVMPSQTPPHGALPAHAGRPCAGCWFAG